MLPARSAIIPVVRSVVLRCSALRWQAEHERAEAIDSSDAPHLREHLLACQAELLKLAMDCAWCHAALAKRAPSVVGKYSAQLNPDSSMYRCMTLQVCSRPGRSQSSPNSCLAAAYAIVGWSIVVAA